MNSRVRRHPAPGRRPRRRARGGLRRVRRRPRPGRRGRAPARRWRRWPGRRRLAPGAVAPQYDRWTVGKAVSARHRVQARRATSAPVRRQAGEGQSERLPHARARRLHQGRRRQRSGTASGWRYHPTRPAGGCAEGKLAFYTTTAKIVDRPLAAQALACIAGGAWSETFPVAVGQARPDHTHRVLLHQPEAPAADAERRLRRAGARHQRVPAQAGLLGRRAGRWRIHGTNEPWLIGKAISHGCVRMQNKDVLEVSRLVPAGSPVEIVK